MTKKRLARSSRANKKETLPPYVRLRPRTQADGTVKNYWAIRKVVSINGKRVPIERYCKPGSLTDYKDVLKQIEREFEQYTEVELEHRNKTFGDLANYFEQAHLKPAHFSNGQKTGKGRRGTYTPLLYLNGYGTKLEAGQKRAALDGPNLGWRNLIGEQTKLSHIDGRLLSRLKDDLFEKYPVEIEKWFPKNGKKRGEKRLVKRTRSFTDVNRRLELLRKMFTVARIDLKWTDRNPFRDSSDPLIERTKEAVRTRLMSFEEEALLRSACDGPREHLLLVITGLVDTCMRSGEFFKLKVGDWQSQELHVQQWTAKTLKSRTVPVSARFGKLIDAWIKDNDLADDDWLLTRRSARQGDTDKDKEGMDSHVNSCRTAWKTALRLVGIKDLRLRDLRRTGATRLLRAGLPLAEISQLLGHTDIKMTMKYIGVDKVSMDRAVGFLDKIHEAAAKELAAKDAAMTIN